MKTKFIGLPDGDKKAKQRLWKYARGCLATFFTWLENCDFVRLKFPLSYTLPFDNVRGSFNVKVGHKESLQFLIAPGSEPGRYIADKVLFVYSGQHGQSVSLEVRDDKVNDLFAYYEKTGAVRIELEKAQRAN